MRSPREFTSLAPRRLLRQLQDDQLPRGPFASSTIEPKTLSSILLPQQHGLPWEFLSLSFLPNDPPWKIPEPATKGMLDLSLAQTRKILFPGFLRRDLADSTLKPVSCLVKAADGREVREGSYCCMGGGGANEDIKELFAEDEYVRVRETTLVYWGTLRCVGSQVSGWGEPYEKTGEFD